MPAVKNFITLQWQRRWDAASTSTDSFVRRHSPEVNNSATIFGNTRREQVLLTRIRTNTLMLNHRLHVIGAHPNGQCNSCPSAEDVNHVLIECPRYAEERKILMRSVLPDQQAVPLTQLLAFENEYTRSAIINFFQKTEITRRLKQEALAHRARPSGMP